MRLCANGGDPGIDRVFHILADTTAVTFNNMTIRHGRLTSTAGGGVYCRSGNLTLDNCKVTSNYASSDGGGINFYILGSFDESLIIRNNSSIDHNKSDGVGGGIYVVYAGTFQIANSRVEYNECDDDGGGIYIDYSAVGDFSDSHISHNESTDNNGGGIYTRNALNDFGIDLHLSRCTLDNNTAADIGGAIRNFDVLFITQCTISGNTATNGDGGGIYNSESLELKHVTIAGNHADSGSGGGIYNIGSSFSVMEHTILGNNAANACPDFYSDRTTIASEQYNLIENDTDCGTFNPASASTTDIFGQDPLLDPLADNGGPTQTHALQDTSPAIDAGDPLFPDPNPLLPNDQHTSPFLRVIDGTIDIGAYESGNVAPIPTINEWGMLMLALLISGSAVWSLRRKRKEL